MQSRIVEIPLNKLVPSDANVRKTNRMLGVEELAANIAARGGQIIQSLAVRPVRDDAGEETGLYRVPAGGRRLAALKLLAKRKIIAKTALVPCIVSEDDEEELSLAENVMREPLHPADQFDAFRLLVDKGQGVEEIGARFGVSAHVVRQRLRLAAVSPVLMQVYRDGGLSLDQLMAFTVSEDHERQEQVHERLASNRSSYLIRRMMVETQVAAREKRAVFVGEEAYTAAGGGVSRDLFTDDDGGWFSDPALLDRLVVEKLDAVTVELVTADGWKWAEASIDYPYDHGLKRLNTRAQALSDEDQARLDILNAQYEKLAADCDAVDEIADDTSAELDALAAEIENLTARKFVFDPETKARAGAFVSLHSDGTLRIECGFVRPEDEIETSSTPIEPRGDDKVAGDVLAPELEEAASTKALSDTLVRELTAHRTMALRWALGEYPEAALIAVVHALAVRTFQGPAGTCLDLTPNSLALGPYAFGIEDTEAGRAVAERHQAWAARIPDDAMERWHFVAALDPAERLALLAHCASLTVTAVREPWDRSGRYVTAADALARATDLNMSDHWKPTAASYFSRVTKARIIEAVREAVSDGAARRIEGMAKSAMADFAETLMANTAWLPTPLRTAAETSPESDAS